MQKEYINFILCAIIIHVKFITDNNYIFMLDESTSKTYSLNDFCHLYRTFVNIVIFEF